MSMTAQERIDKVRKLCDAVEAVKGNVWTLVHLLAVLRDDDLEDFYNEYFNIK